jgi:predicted ATP-dependent endonuclease of OLD family
MGDINALIGANNSGKSNIMRALNIVLGEKWPSQPFGDEDFHRFNDTDPIIIDIYFSTPIQNRPAYVHSTIWGFRLSYDGTHSELVTLDSNGSVVTYGQQNKPVFVSKDMREEVALLYLGLDRQSSQVIRSSKWTLYGKLLQHVEKNIDSVKRDAFTEAVTESYRQNLQPGLQNMENVLKDHVRSQTGLDVSLKLSLFKPLEVISTLRPYLQDASVGFDYDCEDAGAGVQSALAIAIARAYADIVHEPFTVAIEEPELFLHPHGCRHFYNLMKELSAAGVQVIYTTHERSFVQLSEFKSIHRVRKLNGETKVHSSILSTLTPEQCIKYASKFDDSLNEVFFSDLVVMVEGSPDKIACKIALERLGLELDKKNISLVEVGGGGISKIRPICEILNLFAIPSIALVDCDPGNPTTAKEVGRIEATIGGDRVFEQAPNLEGILGLSHKPNKFEAMEAFPDWFETNPMPQVYVDLLAKIREIL